MRNQTARRALLVGLLMLSVIVASAAYSTLARKPKYLQALPQRGYEESDKGSYAGTKEHARGIITLRYQIWEGSMLGLLLLIPLIALCRGSALCLIPWSGIGVGSCEVVTL